MEKRIELEKRARKANQITDLNLDNCRSTSIVGLSEEYTALESLSLINVGLTTLKGFPKLPNLKKLELSDNRISSGLNYLTTSPKLQYLNLSGNKIKDLDTLKPLEEFKNLAILDLFNNEATQIDNYRDKIFEMLPSLKFLDGFDSNDVEAPSDGEDDEEVNGNESDEEDKQSAFCLNGLEIDLDELEAFEQRVRAKKSSTTPTATADSASAVVADEADDLDEYLNELKLKDRCDNEAQVAQVATSDVATSANAVRGTTAEPARPMHFVIFLYWFLAILSMANAAYFSDAIGEDDDEDGEDDDDDDDDSDDEDNGDVSLAEVYNDDLEEDNSDWDEEDAGDDFDDEDTDDEEGDGDANDSSTAPNVAADGDAVEGEGGKDADEEGSEEPQARGKKRKHDG